MRVVSGTVDEMVAPIGLAFHGPDLWVSAASSNGLHEFNATTGALVRIASAPRDKFAAP